MAVRDWSARKLALVWGVGLALEAVPVAAQLAQNRAIARQTEHERAAMLALQATHPVSPARRDSLLRELREKHGVTILMRGNTVTGIQLSPDAERKAEVAATQIGHALQVAAVLAMLFAAVVYLPIPIALVWVTALWVRARRIISPAPTGAPVV